MVKKKSQGLKPLTTVNMSSCIRKKTILDPWDTKSGEEIGLDTTTVKEKSLQKVDYDEPQI